MLPYYLALTNNFLFLAYVMYAMWALRHPIRLGRLTSVSYVRNFLTLSCLVALAWTYTS